MNKILFVGGLQFFPTESGGQLRSATICSILAQLPGREVAIYSLTGRKQNYLNRSKSFQHHPSPAVPGLVEYVNMAPLWGLLQFLCYRLGLPPIGTYLLTHFSFLFPKTLSKLLQEADTLIIDNPFLLPLATRAMAKGKKVILNTHNVEHQLWMKGKKNFLEKIIVNWVKKIEYRAIRVTPNALICSQNDLDYFAQALPAETSKLHLIPNGLFGKGMAVQEGEAAQLRSALGIRPDERLFLFTGSHYPPNQAALRFLREFVGREGNRALLRELRITFLAVGSVASAPSREEGLIVTSRVDSIYPYFQAANYAINPIITGSGSNVKMSEYIHFQLPIFTTAFGTRGLELRRDQDCIFFDLDGPNGLGEALGTFFARSHPEQDGKQMAAMAYAKNRHLVDMEEAVNRQIKLFE